MEGVFGDGFPRTGKGESRFLRARVGAGSETGLSVTGLLTVLVDFPWVKLDWEPNEVRLVVFDGMVDCDVKMRREFKGEGDSSDSASRSISVGVHRGRKARYLPSVVSVSCSLSVSFSLSETTTVHTGIGRAADALLRVSVGVGATDLFGNRFLSRPEFQALRFILADIEGPDDEEATPSGAVSWSRRLGGENGPA